MSQLVLKRTGPAPGAGRRRFLLAGVGVATAGFSGLAFQSVRPPASPTHTPAAIRSILVAFLGSLFGHDLNERDRTELAERLEALLDESPVAHDLKGLARYLDYLARVQLGRAFDACSSEERERIMRHIASIDPTSTAAHALSRLSASERDYYRMRSVAVPQLAWMYRHSPVPWRVRGYSHAPGERGDRHELATPGPSYA